MAKRWGWLLCVGICGCGRGGADPQIPAKFSPASTTPSVASTPAKVPDAPKAAEATPKEGPPAKPMMPAAQLMACVDAGERVEEDDPKVAEMRRSLAAADEAFGEGEAPLRNLAIAGHDELAKAGKPTSCRELLDDLAEIKRTVKKRMDLPEVYAFYMTARVEMGKDRREAIESIQATDRLLDGMTTKAR